MQAAGSKERKKAGAGRGEAEKAVEETEATQGRSPLPGNPRHSGRKPRPQELCRGVGDSQHRVGQAIERARAGPDRSKTMAEVCRGRERARERTPSTGSLLQMPVKTETELS